MSGPPSSGASFLPFVTSITTDIYERINQLNQALEQIKGILKELIIDIKDNLSKVSANVGQMIEQGEMNKQMTLEAFADTTNNLIQQIRSIRNEQLRELQGPQMQQTIEMINKTANILDQRMYDIQIAILINGIHALMNAIKAGKVVGVPVPSKMPVPTPAKTETPKAGLAAPIPTIAASTEGTEADKKFFGRGAKKKTHDEIMEEKRKKDKMYGQFRA